MAQWVTALAALAEGPVLVPSTTVLQLQSQGMLHPLLLSAHTRRTCGAHTCSQNTLIHNTSKIIVKYTLEFLFLRRTWHVAQVTLKLLG